MNKIFTLFMALFLTSAVFAQAPEKMSYQAVIRNSSDQLVTHQQVGMQISIVQGSSAGTLVYEETQSPTTNANGLVSIEIGDGTSSDDFSAIDWSAGPYFIKTETDLTGGTLYSITGTSELLSTPYALHAKTAANVFSGNYADLTNQPFIPANTSDLVNDDGFITNPDDADSDPVNEIQDLQLNGNLLTITNNDLSAGVDLAQYLDNTDTQLTEAEVDAFVANNKVTKEILIGAHMFENASVVNYAPNGYARQVLLCPGNGLTASGQTYYDLPLPSDWDRTNIEFEVYLSAAGTGSTFIMVGFTGFTVGEAGYIAGYQNSECVNIDAANTLYKYSGIQGAGAFSPEDEFMTIYLNRYDYQYAGNTCPDTVDGDVYIHAIRIKYKANL